MRIDYFKVNRSIRYCKIKMHSYRNSPDNISADPDYADEILTCVSCAPSNQIDICKAGKSNGSKFILFIMPDGLIKIRYYNDISYTSNGVSANTVWEGSWTY